jgi:anaerobic selenocysteine-containing dehydrogenase
VSQRHKSICRVCMNWCSVEVETEKDRVLQIRGNRENPIYQGYRCAKGAAQRHLYGHPDRLLHSLERRPDGGFREIGAGQAYARIADRLRPILEEHGPRSIAFYWGTYHLFDSIVNFAFSDGFMRAIGSPMTFNPMTIDQPGKPISKALHGIWMAPDQSTLAPKAALLVGTNPVVSHQGRLGSPARLLRRFEEWGTQLIVIDPRRTETARRAALHLQPRPGCDAPVLAGMIRVILEENGEDAAFLAEHAVGVGALRDAVALFTPDRVAELADVPAVDVVAAARLWYRAGRAYGYVGTGPNMSGGGRGTLVEYLVLCLHTLCGYWSREGDRVTNALTLLPASLQMAKAQAAPPMPVLGAEPVRVRGLTQSIAGMPSAALADEILLEGEGQVRALISAGSPVPALPDQLKTIEAFRSLDLLVQLDVMMSPTARLADYVIACKLQFEQDASTSMLDFYPLYGTGWGYEESHAQYAPAIVAPPPGSEVVEQWELFYGVAQHLGLDIELYAGVGELLSGGDPVAIDMTRKPTSDELMEIVHRGSRIPLEEVKQHPAGALFPDPPVYVDAKDPDWPGRFDIGSAELMPDLAAIADIAAEPDRADDEHPFRLLSRRMAHSMNTPSLAYPENRPRHNPAFMHPADLEELGLADGDVAIISSAHGEIRAVVAHDDTLRRGTVSISHTFGALPWEDEDVFSVGSPVARLVDTDTDFDRFSGHPRMSNIPVSVTKDAPDLASQAALASTTATGSD